MRRVKNAPARDNRIACVNESDVVSILYRLDLSW
jgi:hypothetical protein